MDRLIYFKLAVILRKRIRRNSAWPCMGVATLYGYSSASRAFSLEVLQDHTIITRCQRI